MSAKIPTFDTWKAFLFPVAMCEEVPSVLQNLSPGTSGSADDNSIIQQAELKHKELKGLPNPGTYERIHDDAKTVLSLDNFDGFRLDFSKPVGERLGLTHSLWLGTQLIPGGTYYSFGANAMVGGEGQKPGAMLMSRVTLDGRVDTRWHQTINPKLSTRVHAMLSPEAHQSEASLDVDYLGDDFGINAKASNGMVIGLSYLQSVTKSLAIGGEGYYHGGKKASVTSYSLKYNVPEWVGTLTYTMGVFQLQYTRKLNQRWNLASELLYQPGGESKASVGVMCSMRASRFATKVDQDGKVSSTLESKISPSLALLFSGEINHPSSEYRFGYGIHMGQ